MPDISPADFAAAADQLEAALHVGIAQQFESHYFVQNQKNGDVFF